jgi:hypothetical protein
MELTNAVLDLPKLQHFLTAHSVTQCLEALLMTQQYVKKV